MFSFFSIHGLDQVSSLGKIHLAFAHNRMLLVNFNPHNGIDGNVKRLR